MQSLAIFFLVAAAMGGVAWVFVYPTLSGEKKARQRRESVTRADITANRERVRSGAAQQRSRRDTVESALKDIESRHQKQKKVPLDGKIAQAGLTWSQQRYYATAGGLGLAAFLLMFMAGMGLPIALAAGFAAGFGVPIWFLKFLKKRREAKFLNAFPDAVDVIVRGVKAGLPLLDCLKMVMTDAPEPLRSEFRHVVETQAIGIPLGEACVKLYERMPVPEANFFGIVISIQQKAGGNLSETLGNLSRVLRDRKKMKGKIQAMSTEAKASAMIIGCLPLAVMILVYLSSPQYIMLLFTEPLGRLLLAGSGAWMFMGVMVMRKMINFDF